MESQRAHGRTCARECASRAQQSAKVRHDAGASHNACSRPMTLEAPAQYIVNREGEGEAWNQRPSPMFVKSSRDRAETSPMSPPATASPMGIDGKERGFFTDSSRYMFTCSLVQGNLPCVEAVARVGLTGGAMCSRRCRTGA